MSRKQHCHIRLETEQVNLLQELSQQNGLTLSSVIRSLLDDYLKVYNYTKNNNKLKLD